ncbi:unnamed protein product [Auanema sp. JU1783]|nr:unnamed protein product [Auanema sp. JU1783]
MLLIFLWLILPIFGAKNIPSNPGRVCGFGDFNNDRNTDIIVQRGENLTILLQEDKILTIEEGTFRNSSSFHVGHRIVECSLGDFNGDSRLDVLVSSKHDDEYKHSVWFGSDSGYYEVVLDLLQAQAMAIDIDGDGFHDVFGFYQNGSMYCQKFDKSGSKDESCSKLFSKFEPIKAYEGIPHLYVDIFGGDLLAEIVLMLDKDGYLDMQVWRRYKNGWQISPSSIPSLGSSPIFEYVGAPIPADFDADGLMELLVPICESRDCSKVSEVYIWQSGKNWTKHPLDISDLTIVSDKNSKVLFRVGDFSMDGYPDLLVTAIEKGKNPLPRVLENQACSNCEKNGTKKFEVKKPLFIQPKDIALGTITMTSFFDLKEDGSLDILVEYNTTEWDELRFSFIPCDYKGDTTFLKIQVFTSVCDKNCNPDSNELGSGISWGGSCMSFSMSDGWGGSLKSASCQLPAVTHRSLMAPFVLFGLGRSPNFVDELTIGVPRYSARIAGPSRQHVLKQIVPNSRLSIMPPSGEGTHWLNRLYVTPSQLILQSILVIVLVCSILLMVVALLHYREKKEDRMERQQQSQRFHFDAM